MVGPAPRVVDVAEHDRGGRTHTQLVSLDHDVCPLRGTDLVGAQMQPDIVIEDLGGGAGKCPQPGVSKRARETCRHEMPSVSAPCHTSSGVNPWMCMSGNSALMRLDHTDVEVAGELGVDPALKRHLGGTLLPCLLRPLDDLGYPHEVGIASQVEAAWALRERAEAAPEVAHVGVVDVAIHHVGDGVTDRLFPEPIGREGDSVDLIAAGTEQLFDLVTCRRRSRRESARGSGRRVPAPSRPDGATPPTQPASGHSAENRSGRDREAPRPCPVPRYTGAGPTPDASTWASQAVNSGAVTARLWHRRPRPDRQRRPLHERDGRPARRAARRFARHPSHGAGDPPHRPELLRAPAGRRRRTPTRRHREPGTIQAFDSIGDVRSTGPQEGGVTPGHRVEHGIVVVAIDHRDPPTRYPRFSRPRASAGSTTHAAGIGVTDRRPTPRASWRSAPAATVAASGTGISMAVVPSRRRVDACDRVEGLGGPDPQERDGHGVVSICGARAYPLSSVDRSALASTTGSIHSASMYSG